MKKFLYFSIFLLVFQISFSQDFLLVKIEGEITFSKKELIKDAISFAEKNNYQGIILTIDSNGGDFDSTLEIIKLIDRSKVPIISFVYPKGATAWSAAIFILISSHVAVMSENSIIGSAQPIIISSEGIKAINESKIINAIIALIEERARIYNRNYTIVKEFIISNLNLNAEQAKNLNVIDFIANDFNELLEKLNDYKIKNFKFETKNSKVVDFSNVRFKFLDIISNKAIASIMLIIGIYILIFGLSNPGYFSEVVGAVLIILALLNLGLNINVASLIFIIIGATLIIYEVFFAVTFGTLAILGLILVSMGSLMISEFSISNLEIFLPLIISLSIFFSIIFIKVVKVRKARPFHSPIGKTGIAIENIYPKKIGYIKIEGELWKAKSKKRIRKNEKIIVIDKEDSTLIVDRI